MTWGHIFLQPHDENNQRSLSTQPLTQEPMAETTLNYQG